MRFTSVLRFLSFSRSTPSIEGGANGRSSRSRANVPSSSSSVRDLAGIPHDELLQRLRAPDPGVARPAFDTLFTATYADLVTFTFRALAGKPGAFEIAEDLVMDLFRRLWDRREAWSPGDIRVYLFGAMRNAVFSHRRDISRRQELVHGAIPDADTFVMQPQLLPDQQVEETLRMAALEAAVEELPERQRLIFTMRREQGLANAEVAAVLGIAVKTVEKELTALIKTLRAVFFER